ncbi:MAG TPA: hypothetical protein P5279_12020 [Anaerohalosphaeraceae bacterium]|jgi:hypothetical protein|nr:hypothetical protein [Anaerohalosphaeraceae bacterium]HRT51216.1 hypothetical protein [Anaerohalosphaeraceae bacterium]HRT88357.1 hypothetical protein [Anaerohalosphaeraceae bacterium]
MITRPCTVAENLVIQRGRLADYEALARFHYRAAPCRPCAAIFVLKHKRTPLRIARIFPPLSLRYEPAPCRIENEKSKTETAIGVIVYTNPPANRAARNIATNHVITRTPDRRAQLRLINRNIRTIARVIIDPRYRGLGLAAQLVRRTMPLLDVPIIEAAAAMGAVHRFFERAGMTPCPAPHSPAAADCIAALRAAGITPADEVDAQRVQRKLDALPAPAAQRIDTAFRRFLKPCIKRRQMPPGLERTRFILARLGPPPAYYIWFNPDKPPDWTIEAE